MKPRKKQGKDKATTPAPRTVMSSGVSQTPIQQQVNLLKTVYADEGDDYLDMPQDMAEKIVGTAVIKVMEGHFAKLYLKINNLKTEVSTLKTTVASLVEENKKMDEVRGNAPDPDLQPPATPRTPTKDLTIRPRPVLPAQRKRVGTALASVRARMPAFGLIVIRMVIIEIRLQTWIRVILDVDVSR